ncbi:hypothetical protein Ate01nite_31030 [Actinoplanes teichomyceticus]|nr:hypothetical protein Ate01nite_31030 [Actinoplanes teichomyceticus]
MGASRLPEVLTRPAGPRSCFVSNPLPTCFGQDQIAVSAFGPWDWRAYDEHGGAPAWPLTLLPGSDSSADAERSAQVVATTRTGSHEAEIEKWRRAAQAEPPSR